jgi:hypothetical protein
MNKTQVFIVEERANPSTDFFVLPQFQGDQFEVKRCHFDEMVKPELLVGAIVVFVRYLPKAWRQLIVKNRAAIQALHFFMDDDLLDISASQGMPLRYRWKLARLTTFHKSWLVKQAAELWVSTPFLAHKYQAWSPELIEPKPIKPIKESVKVFYHGSASHKAEIEWLLPVIKAVLERNAHICFEIIGGQSVYKAFKGMPRVQVVHPMGWEAYQHFIQQPGRHIGLAPLLPNAFNQARSYTKVFDITQAGAVGIYSQGSESTHYLEACSSAENVSSPGLVLPLEPSLWIAAILDLAENTSKRQVMINQACLLVVQS